jgi:hypothetical protein
MRRRSMRYRGFSKPPSPTALRIVGLVCVPLLASCAEAFASKVSMQEASKYQRIEDFVHGNFRTTGWKVLEDGSMRYVESFCAGDNDALRKPGDDLGTFCEAKAGVFQSRRTDAARRSLPPGLPSYAESDYDCNAQGTSTPIPGSNRSVSNPGALLWNASVRIEGIGPGVRPNCFRVALMIRGETWTAEKQAAESRREQERDKEEREKARRAREQSEQD